MPAGPAGFVNRTAVLERLTGILGPQPGGEPVVISAITGAPGVGKTALALRWASQVRHRFPDGDLYIDMRGYGPGPPISEEQALDAFLRSLGVPSGMMPVDARERAALYRSAVSGRRLMIVLDNVASARQVRQLLPGAGDSLVIITSARACPAWSREKERRA